MFAPHGAVVSEHVGSANGETRSVGILPSADDDVVAVHRDRVSKLRVDDCVRCDELLLFDPIGSVVAEDVGRARVRDGRFVVLLRSDDEHIAIEVDVPAEAGAGHHIRSEDLDLLAPCRSVEAPDLNRAGARAEVVVIGESNHSDVAVDRNGGSEAVVRSGHGVEEDLLFDPIRAVEAVDVRSSRVAVCAAVVTRRTDDGQVSGAVEVDGGAIAVAGGGSRCVEFVSLALTMSRGRGECEGRQGD